MVKRPRMPACCVLLCALFLTGTGQAADPPASSTLQRRPEHAGPAELNARAPLSLPDKKAIVRWHRLFLDEPELTDFWWSGKVNRRKKTDERPGGRKWFFTGFEVGKATAEFMDIEALGFSSFPGVTRYRVQSLLYAPLTDAAELRARQGAIAELMAAQSGVRARIAEIRASDSATRWMPIFFNEKSSDPTTAKVVDIAAEEGHYRTDLEERRARNPDFSGEVLRNHGYCTRRAKHRRDFFRDALKLAEALNNEDVGSTRLRQLGWLMKWIINEEKGLSGAWIQRFIKTKDMLEHYDLLDKADEYREDHKRDWIRTRLGRRIDLLREAVSEVLMYAEMADYAVARNWTTFPKVLDPREAGRPVLRITEGHAPRVLRDWLAWSEGRSKKEVPESVPNTIELGVKGKRHAIISGPNNKGKTTTLRMAGQFLSMAQMGLPVPAKEMEWTPMGLNVLLRPGDDAVRGKGQFEAEIEQLFEVLLRRARKDPFQLVLMDESATGTIEPLREDFGKRFFHTLDRTGVLSIYTTHTLGTTKLGKRRNWISRALLRRKSNPFFNLHVDTEYNLKPGAATNLEPFYEALTQVLSRHDVDRSFIEDLAEDGRRRNNKLIPRLRRLLSGWRKR